MVAFSLNLVGTQEEWGGGRPVDVLAVCRSAARSFEVAIAERPLEAIRIEPGNLGHPRVLFERSEEGEIRILLSARGRLWAKIAYQFSHEFCHALANPISLPSHWIGESFCELASIFAVRSMARSWRESPPYPNWRDYAVGLQSYADEFLADPKHQIPEVLSFADWLGQRLPLLEQDPYRRDENAIVAIKLLPLFENDPSLWRAIRYLNLWRPPNDDTHFSRYFDVWRSVTPPGLHGAVNQIEYGLKQK